jgi:hypothetical protein
MDAVIITIAPDGTARCLWTEAVPLHELGRLEIQRAFSVEFDNQAQAWCVFDAMGDCLYGSPSRETCLAWERRHLNWVLDNPQPRPTN